MIDGDRVFLGNKATGKGDVITLKRLTQFGDSIRLYKNHGTFGGYWGEGPLLRDYIIERRAAVKATA